MTGLRVPRSWAEEYCRVTAPDLFAPCDAEATAVELAYLPRQRWVQLHDPNELAADLAGGLVVERRVGDDGPYFRLGGARYDVFVQRRVESDTGTVQAFVTSVKPARGQGRTEMVRPASVGLAEVWDAAASDLEWLCETFAEGLRVIRRRRVALDNARRGLDAAGIAPRAHGELHAKVRRRYQALQLMLRLLEQRSTLEGAVTAAGEALETGPGDDGDLLWVRLPGRAGFVEGRTVSVAVPGRRPRNLRIHAVEEGGALLAVSAPREDVEPGTPLRLEQQGRFALGKHSAALRGFLDEQVEGSWTHLAQLLCEPGRLPVVEMQPVRHFFDTRLNPEQKAAVTGAVGSPHAFFVQGPPGTGKTTVITEVVRQLLARGERVLLLAPMHVAVDEVLGRVADQPGVLALRISWDEARVHPDLRRYLPEQASRTYLQLARRPETSQATRWHEEITALRWQAEAVTVQLAARGHQRQAAGELAAAETAYRQWREHLAAAVTRADADANAANQALHILAPHLPPAAAQAATLRAQLDAVPFGQRAWSSIRGVFGAGNAVAELAAGCRRAEDYHRRLLDDQRTWTGRYADAQRRGAAARTEWSAGEPAHQDAIRRRRTALATAQRAVQGNVEDLREVVGRDPGAVTDQELIDGRARIECEIARRHHRITLEQRWFSLSGLSDRGGDALVEQVDADLRRSANMICCTTTGVTRDLGDSDFDTLIVDEASRVIDSEFLIGATRARRWVLVGDERQLPPYVEPADEHHLHALSALRMVDRGGEANLKGAVDRLGKRWTEDEELHQFRAETVERTATALRDSGIWRREYRTTFDESWSQLRRLGGDAERTLLSAMLDHLVRSLFERAVTEMPPTLRQPLVWQRRMIEPIAALVRDPVYGGEYRTPRPSEVRPLRYGPTKTPVVFVDTAAHGRRAAARTVNNGFVNDLEVELVAKMCRGWERRLRQSSGEPVTASVLTFYRAQSAAIRKELGGPRYPDFRLLQFKVVDAIDKIQGQEADLVFLSFCRAFLGRGELSDQYGRWLQDVRRLNVACTRARRGLILVGHAATLRRLNGVPAAQAFYQNLFRQFAARPGDMQIVPDVG